MARSRSGTSDLFRTFADAPQPVYLLNSRRALVYANPACAEWLGVPIEELLGAQCDYHSAALAQAAPAVAAGLCPPPEAFLAAHARGLVSAERDGVVTTRPAHFFTLLLPEEAAPAVLALVEAGAPREDAPAMGPEEPSSAELHVLLRWLRHSQGARPALDPWRGDTPEVRRVRAQFAAATASRARVLIVGPAGAGGRALARGIVDGDAPADHAAVIHVDCAAVDAEALQLSVTSLARRCGAAGLAAPAAVILEQADRLAADAQRELRGFLELPGFEVRTVATAGRSLAAMAEEGRYDRALACALSTLVIELPSLRARLADLPLLAQMFVEERNAVGGKQLSGLTSEALDRLAVYAWPGDLDQLGEVIHEAWTAAAGPRITLGDLPRWLRSAEDAAARAPRDDAPIVLDELLAEIERELFARALARARGNKAQAARLLGVSRPRLLRRLEQLGLLETADASPEIAPSDVFTPWSEED